MNANKVRAIGIDLGTTNSCVSYWDETSARARTIELSWNEDDEEKKKKKKTLRSVVSYKILPNGELKVDRIGEHALERYGIHLLQSSSSSSHDDESDKYLVVESAKRKLGQKDFRFYPNGITRRTKCSILPEEVLADLLSYMKSQAEKALKQPITKAVITVPAHFNEKQRELTKMAGEMAGFEVLRTLSEPTAAALAYGFRAPNKKIMVIDFGGGTFDVSLLKMQDGTFTTIALGGDNELGGDDIDRALMNEFIQHFSLQDLHHPAKLSQLKFACEVAKKSLSNVDHTIAEIEFQQQTMRVTREEFNRITQPIIDRCIEIVNQVLPVNEELFMIHEVILIGGSSKIPIFRDRVQEIFPHLELSTSLKGDRVVAQGAAIQAAILTGSDELHLAKILMLDVIPYSIGIENIDGNLEVMIPKNSLIPTKIIKRFYTHVDYQRAFSVDLFEGEKIKAHDNKWLGSYNFIIPNGRYFKAGERSLNISLQVDDEGSLIVDGLPPEDELELCGAYSNPELEKQESYRQVLILSVLILAFSILYFYFRFAPPIPRKN